MLDRLWPEFLDSKAKEFEALEYRDDPDGIIGTPTTYFRDASEACRRALEIWRRCTDNLKCEVGLIESLCAMMIEYVKTREDTVRITTAGLLRLEARSTAALEMADLIEAGEMEGWNELRM